MISTIKHFPFVVEQQNTDNGVLRKWSDGTMEFWSQGSVSVNGNATKNDVYVQYPEAFTSAPRVFVTMRAGGAKLYHVHCLSDGTNATRARLFFANDYSGSVDIGYSLYAIGKYQ